MSHDPIEDADGLAAFYDSILAEHGDGARAGGWQSLSQQTNFAQLARTDGLVNGAKVLDVGCGLGAFKGFLDRRGIDVQYTGYDLSGPAIEGARERFPGASFEVRNFAAQPPAERFDVVVASGLMGMRVGDGDEWVTGLIERLYAATDHALAFNLLSEPFALHAQAHVDPSYYYANPAAILNLCMSHTPRVVLDHAEQANLFTVFMYRDARVAIDRARALCGEPGPYGEAQDSFVEHCLMHDEPERAMAFLEQQPVGAARFEAMGRVAFRLGDHERQLEYWRRAAELAPDDAGLAERVRFLREWIES